MTATRIRALIVFVAMVTTAALAHWTTPTTHLSDVLGKPDLEKILSH